jgi:hypothetical protein
MDSWQFIKETAEAMGIKPDAIRKWRSIGVPRMHRLEIVKAADRAGFELDEGVFDHPPIRRRASAEAA